MEPNDTRLTSYFHHHQQQPQPPPPPPPQPQPHHQTQNPVAATAASPSNGLLPPSERPPLGYHHSVPSAVTSPPETVRRKRGRPRKYGTSEQGLSAKKSPSSSVPVPKKKEQGLGGSSKIGLTLCLLGQLLLSQRSFPPYSHMCLSTTACTLSLSLALSKV